VIECDLFLFDGDVATFLKDLLPLCLGGRIGLAMCTFAVVIE
jgi:hypothetical protein